MDLAADFRHYVLVRFGFLPPRGSDYLGTGLQPSEFRAIQALFHFSRMRSFDNLVIHDHPVAARAYERLKARARRWRILVAEVDRIETKVKQQPLGQAYAFGHQPGLDNTFPASANEFKHVILILRCQPTLTRYATLLHELAHVLLGHIGKRLNVEMIEADAELSAYVASRRNGFDISGHTVCYLNKFTTHIDEPHWPQLRRIGRAATRLDQLRLMKDPH